MLLPYYGFSMVCLVWVVDVDGVWLHACCVWCCVVLCGGWLLLLLEVVAGRQIFIS